MKRSSRILFRSLTVLSLLLSATTSALWVRSHWRFDRWKNNSLNATQSVISMSGRLILTQAKAPGVTSKGSSTLTGPSPGFHSFAASPSATESIIIDRPGGFAHIQIANRWGAQATGPLCCFSLFCRHCYGSSGLARCKEGAARNVVTICAPRPTDVRSVELSPPKVRHEEAGFGRWAKV